MRYMETKIPQFYDVLEDELFIIRDVYNNYFLRDARNKGFIEIETSAIELRERYLQATDVHFSKIFEVQRPKEKTRFVLQADLAMSMSRFIADLPTVSPPIKMIQLGTMFRDRINKIPGYRREFKQILLGSWGITSLFADAELIALCHESLEKLQDIEICYIQISNQNIFNAIDTDLAKKVRFDSLDALNQVALNSQDKQIISELFSDNKVDPDKYIEMVSKFSDCRIKQEVNYTIEIFNYLKMIVPNAKIFFSLSNLDGTGHYSGMNYQIYVRVNGNQEILIADGGRIDTLCNKFNKSKSIPAVCMGIGVQFLAQLMQTMQNNNKIAILVDEKDLLSNFENIEKVKNILNNFNCSVLPIKMQKKKQILLSEFYSGHVFIIFEDSKISVRANDKNIKNKIETKLNELL